MNAPTYDLVLRGGTIVDGTGSEPFAGDVAVTGETIVAVGHVPGRGAKEVDTTGYLVTPGFIDLHTHFDAQVTWGSRLSPSSNHGVTTVVIGNCGVGFAPCQPSRRDMLVKLMEGVEDIPEAILTAGVPFEWETFPEFLDFLEHREFDADVVALLPHAPVRVHTMDRRAADLEMATADDREAMAELAREGLRSGACGFSTSRTLNHKTLAGEHTPTLRAAEEELLAIATALKEHGKGFLQVISDFDDEEAEFAMLRRLAERSGRPVVITVLQATKKPDAWKRILDRIAKANQDGLAIYGQVLSRSISVFLGFEASQNPFSECPAYKDVAHLPLEERVRELARPEVRERLLSQFDSTNLVTERWTDFAHIFELGARPAYEPAPEDSIAARAERAGVSAAAFALDRMLDNGGCTLLVRPLSNYCHGNLDVVQEMLNHPNTLVGLGDGGAHVGLICDSSNTTHLLTHWTRDRARGSRFSVPWAIHKLTQQPASFLQLDDRGVIEVGYKADINVIDYLNLQLVHPEIVYDLPNSGRRLDQRAEGYVATFVAGVQTYANGKPTGNLPGRLMRGPKASDMVSAGAIFVDRAFPADDVARS